MYNNKDNYMIISQGILVNSWSNDIVCNKCKCVYKTKLCNLQELPDFREGSCWITNCPNCDDKNFVYK